MIWLSRWIGLAASPVFGVMAADAALRSDGLAALCTPSPVAGLDGMATMYALMAAAHSPAWIRLLATR
ncbi:hypothetical protein P7B02_10045 [Caulobacter segnis]|uniref:hypothetical protein n=1 Tax=Caulobacter segnis TaxID=88688 RepID=UPI00240EDF6C|nr:hypothetical protein [Caulobacter segnis]MDG2521884.1 hypothetical protein [Caulobacter segnis]